jgi:hypothetical protein
MNTDYRPRLSIEIPQETSVRLRKLMPHGMQKLVFNLIVEDLLDLMEEHGSGKVIGAYVSRAVSLEDITKTKL